MANRKSVRERGKFSFSKYFQRFKEGDTVAISIERSLHTPVPKRMQGRTGVVKGKRGSSYVVEVKDYNKEKTFLLRPIHLKKLNSSN